MLFIMLAAFSLNRDRLLLEVYHIVENNAVSTISVEEADDGRSKIMMMNGGGASKVSEDPELRFGYVRFVEDNFISRLPVRRRRYSLSAPAALPWGLMMTSTVIPMLTSTPR